MYIYQRRGWPEFTWDKKALDQLVSNLHHKQGRLTGRMEGLGFSLRSEAILQTLTLDALKSNEIEGEILNQDQVRSSIARRLGLDVAGLIPADRKVDGVVEMLLDATQNYHSKLTEKRLFDWHAALFPLGRSGMHQITVAGWRNNKAGLMQVVSGAIGHERVHFEAPEAALLSQEMENFIRWFNEDSNPIDPVLKAAIAHLWFVTVHPFDDGNGRIGRTIADMLLARADGSSQRFYSMSVQIQKERNSYYHILEKIQKGDLDITEWLEWFLACLDRALSTSEETLTLILTKARYWEIFSGKEISSRQRLMLNKLLDGFEGKLTSSKWAKITKSSHDTALRDIQDLIDKEILVKETSGGRSTSYVLIDIG
jgi:Fic family protein